MTHLARIHLRARITAVKSKEMARIIVCGTRYGTIAPKNYQQSNWSELVDVHAQGGLEEDPEL